MGTASMSTDKEIREHVSKVLDWGDAHADFEAVLDGIPPAQRGVQPDGLPYSAWQLLEHLRLAQLDIYDFCVNAKYTQMKWPDDYWPKSPEPPSDAAWDKSLEGYRRDLEKLQALAMDTSIDLTARIPHGEGQTYLRELLLVADHTAYHLGQLVLVRRLLGNWHPRT